MGLATLKEKMKQTVKQLLQIKAVKKVLNKAKHYHRIFQEWLFQSKLVHVDRKKYLRYRLKGVCTPEEIEAAIETSPIAAIGKERTNKLIRRCIWKHSLFTAALSALAAISSNTYIQIVSIVFDLLQFQLMTYLVVQKLLYLHGYHDLRDKDGKQMRKAAIMMSAISLLMIGRHRVGNMMKKLAKSAAKKAIRAYTRVGGRVILTNFIRQAFKWLGISATRDTITMSATITIGIMCAILAGIISFWLFYPMCNRLNRNMTSQDLDTISKKIKEDIEEKST